MLGDRLPPSPTVGVPPDHRPRFEAPIGQGEAAARPVARRIMVQGIEEPAFPPRSFLAEL